MLRLLVCSAALALTLPLAGCATSPPPAAPTASSASASGTDEGVVLVGVWNYSVASPGGGDRGTFTIAGAPGAYEGEIIAQGQPIAIDDIVLNGRELSFLFRVGNGPLVRCSGTITDRTFDGTADAGGFGSFLMTATRES